MGELWQGDLDLGRAAAERLKGEDLGPDVAVEDLSYGAVPVAWRLDEEPPRALVLVGTAERRRPPGTVERRAVEPFEVPPIQARRAVEEACTGYLGVELLVEVAAVFGVLPEHTVVVDVEPASRLPSTELSPACAAALEQALRLVRAEVRAVRHAGLAGRAAGKQVVEP